MPPRVEWEGGSRESQRKLRKSLRVRRPLLRRIRRGICADHGDEGERERETVFLGKRLYIGAAPLGAKLVHPLRSHSAPTAMAATIVRRRGAPPTLPHPHLPPVWRLCKTTVALQNHRATACA